MAHNLPKKRMLNRMKQIEEESSPSPSSPGSLDMSHLSSPESFNLELLECVGTDTVDSNHVSPEFYNSHMPDSRDTSSMAARKGSFLNRSVPTPGKQNYLPRPSGKYLAPLNCTSSSPEEDNSDTSITSTNAMSTSSTTFSLRPPVLEPNDRTVRYSGELHSVPCGGPKKDIYNKSFMETPIVTSRVDKKEACSLSAVPSWPIWTNGRDYPPPPTLQPAFTFGTFPCVSEEQSYSNSGTSQWNSTVNCTQIRRESREATGRTSCSGGLTQVVPCVVSRGGEDGAGSASTSDTFIHRPSTDTTRPHTPLSSDWGSDLTDRLCFNSSPSPSSLPISEEINYLSSPLLKGLASSDDMYVTMDQTESYEAAVRAEAEYNQQRPAGSSQQYDPASLCIKQEERPTSTSHPGNHQFSSISSSSGGEASVKLEGLVDGQGQSGSCKVTSSGRNRGTRKASDPKFDCQVCGDLAAGFHCGAHVCEACKVGDQLQSSPWI